MPEPEKKPIKLVRVNEDELHLIDEEENREYTVKRNPDKSRTVERKPVTPNADPPVPDANKDFFDWE